MRSWALFFCLAASATAGEYAVLSGSSARIHIDRHEMDGSTVRLYTGPGFIQMPVNAVEAFEGDESASTPPVREPLAPVPQAAPALPTPQELADAAADKYGLPRKLVRSVMAAESAFQPNAVSPKGAIGLMQLMPATAQTLGVDPYDPVQNVDAGTRYLRDLLIRYDGLLWHALAAYNAGPGAVDKYKNIPPYPETLRYISRIDKDYKR